jgi:acyl-CoA thioesterase
VEDSSPSDPRLADIAARLAGSPFHRWAGIELVRAEPGEVEVAMRVEQHHLNLLGTAHGGMVAALADTAMGLAVRTLAEPGTVHVTAQLNVHYLAPGRRGRVSAVGRLVAGGDVRYAEADVFAPRGRLLARASATFVAAGRGRLGAS